MSQQDSTTALRRDGTVAAAFPIALLESMRAHDRPGEILEDEDLSVSLPRRLGLTGVVETQIQRYETAQRAGRPVALDELLGLIRLVMRRPDREPILRETGQRIARWQLRQLPEFWQKILHRAPNRLGMRSARRTAVRTLRALHAGTRIDAAGPFTISVHDCITADLQDGDGCMMLTSMLEEMLLITTGSMHRVQHSRCSRRGDDACEWSRRDAEARSNG